MSDRFEHDGASCALRLVPPGTVLGYDRVDEDRHGLVIGSPSAAAYVITGTLDELADFGHRVAAVIRGAQRGRPTDDHDSTPRASTNATPDGETAVHDRHIRTFLDLSTAHLTRATRVNLNSYEGVTAYPTGYGWLMFVPTDAARRAEILDWPRELLPIVELAVEGGCAYILFDADADQAEGLPSFDW